MNVSRYVCVLGLTVITVFSGMPARAASPTSAIATKTAFTAPNETTSPTAIDAKARRDIVAKLSEALRDRYIFPEVGERAAARIRPIVLDQEGKIVASLPPIPAPLEE